MAADQRLQMFPTAQAPDFTSFLPGLATAFTEIEVNNVMQTAASSITEDGAFLKRQHQHVILPGC